jgi:nucleoid-associated protein YgaU
MRKYLIVLVVLGFLIGCSSKEAVEEADVSEQAQQDTVVTEEEEKDVKTETEPTAVKPEEKEKAELKAVPEKDKKAELKKDEKKKEEKEALPDSVNVIYMTRPGDFLTKIAVNEYGRVSVWRKIWDWNYEKIGDNPDLIFPYQEYDLKKPREVAKPVKYDLYDYTVEPGETLWSIANKEYGNNYAWVVILRDNFDLLGNDYDTLEPGTTLKLRTKLY